MIGKSVLNPDFQGKHLIQFQRDAPGRGWLGGEVVQGKKKSTIDMK